MCDDDYYNAFLARASAKITRRYYLRGPAITTRSTDASSLFFYFEDHCVMIKLE